MYQLCKSSKILQYACTCGLLFCSSLGRILGLGNTNNLGIGVGLSGSMAHLLSYSRLLATAEWNIGSEWAWLLSQTVPASVRAYKNERRIGER